MEIARASQNSLNIKINELLHHVMRKHQYNLNALLGTSSSIREHRKILVAIEEQDPELAVYYMTRHLERTVAQVRDSDGTSGTT
jgi:DNA-binding FadR family transcriptional regulator